MNLTRAFASFLPSALIIAFVSSCGDPSTSPSIPNDRPQIVGVASVRSQLDTPTTFPANSLWGLETSQSFRVPRSLLEFSNALSQSSIVFNSDSAIGKKYKLMYWNLRAWRAVSLDTVFRYWWSVEGFPEEAVFATNISQQPGTNILYKVNYSGWHLLRPGIDWGLVGLDSIDIGDSTFNRLNRAGWSVFSVDLTINGKNVLFEGDNVLSVRIVQNRDTVFTKTFNARYEIR